MTPRILVGTKEVARIVYNLTKGLRELGYEADSFVATRPRFYPDCDYTYVGVDVVEGIKYREDKNRRVRPLELTRKLRALIKKYDIFIFVGSTSFLPRMIDFPLLKEMGKTIIAVQCGSDVRDYDLARFFHASHKRRCSYCQNDNEASKVVLRREVDVAGLDVYNPHLASKLHNNRMCEKYADITTTGPASGTLKIRPYFTGGVSVDVTSCQYEFNGRSRPLIAHFPSRVVGKDSDLILSTLQELKEEGVEFDVVAKSGVPHAEVLRNLTQADILIDHIGCGIGALAIEGNASGCAVVSGYTPAEQPFPRNKSICNVYDDTLKEQIKKVILDMNYRRHLIERGKEYVDCGFNSPKSIAQHILEGLENEKKGIVDIYPTLFTSCSSLLKNKSASVPRYIKDMTVDILKKYGTHEDTKIQDLVDSGMIPDLGLKDKDIPRWDSSKLQEEGPFVLTHKDIDYGMKL